MENDNSTQKNHTIQPNEGDVHGRTYNSRNPTVDKASASADISAVDQQEGTMDVGETGADVFKENKNDQPDKGTA